MRAASGGRWKPVIRVQLQLGGVCAHGCAKDGGGDRIPGSAKEGWSGASSPASLVPREVEAGAVEPSNARAVAAAAEPVETMSSGSERDPRAGGGGGEATGVRREKCVGATGCRSRNALSGNKS
jgi:hypothetical protein